MSRVTFEFDGTFSIVSGTNYAIVITDLANTNELAVGFDGSAPTDPGNMATRSVAFNFWAAQGGSDMIYYLYSTLGTILAKVSGVGSVAASEDSDITSGISPVLLDSYSESNQSLEATIRTAGGGDKFGQAFTAPATGPLTIASFYIRNDGSGTNGDIFVSLYAATGTVGTNATATGSPLAVSQVINSA